MMGPKPRPGRKNAPAQALGTTSDNVATAAAMGAAGTGSSTEHEPSTAAYAAGSTDPQGDLDSLNADTALCTIYGSLLTLEDDFMVGMLTEEQSNNLQCLLATTEVTEVKAAIDKLKPRGSEAEKDRLLQAAMHAREAGAAMLNASPAASTDQSEGGEGEPGEGHYKSLDTVEAESMEKIDRVSNKIISVVKQEVGGLKEDVKMQIQQAAKSTPNWR